MVLSSGSGGTHRNYSFKKGFIGWKVWVAVANVTCTSHVHRLACHNALVCGMLVHLSKHRFAVKVWSYVGQGGCCA